MQEVRYILKGSGYFDVRDLKEHLLQRKQGSLFLVAEEKGWNFSYLFLINIQTLVKRQCFLVSCFGFNSV